MTGACRALISRLTIVIRKPGFWIILGLFVILTLPHYHEAFGYPALLTYIIPTVDLSRHTLERILYLVPIVWAGFLFGLRGTVITSLVALACMLPRAIFMSPSLTDAIAETGAVFLAGGSISGLLAFSFKSLRQGREYQVQLETAHQELESHIQIIEENEKRLAALNQISSTVSQSLELSQVLDNAIDNVIDVMQVEIALVFLLDEEAGQLIMAAHRGVSAEFVQGVDKLKLGEGLNGRVAESGESLYIEDASQDPSLTKMAVRGEGIRSQLIVPLKSKGKVVGTLCVAARSHRQVLPEELGLVTAIGNQIGVAVENAHLYQQQQEIAEQLRVSEQRYRELFENAYDSIWLHDLQDNIIAANKSLASLTGYTPEELSDIKSADLFTGGCIDSIRDMEYPLSRGEVMGYLLEVTLVKKDKSEASVQLSTSPVFSNGQIVGFQHIARDITEQKQMQENQRFYLQQATRAQEEERKRISHELHDETIQALVVLSRQLDTLASSDKGLSEDSRLRLEELWQQTNSIMQGVRRLSQDLRPAALDRLGLLAALEWLASDVAEYSGIATKLNVLGSRRRLTEEVQLVLFRIGQEALRNVWRHSQATKAEITVEFDESKTRIIVSDNGKGFNLPQTIDVLAKDGKLGLAGMQERARLIGGTLTVQSQPGKGSIITVELPASLVTDEFGN
jgi:PAS domain S-box-containing protein